MHFPKSKRTINALQVILRVAIIVYSFQTSESRQKKWHETTSIYEIYTRSFKDTNADGIGDIRGVHEKLDYIQSVGYETVWVQAILKSPMVDMGYDVSNYKEVDPVFGTIEELKSLIQDIHNRGMKVMMDFVPNHTSNESEWFSKSVKKEEPYTDFYVWQDPKGFDPKTNEPIPPNNWMCMFGGSMWEWNEQRKQFYLHQYATVQADLNYRNPDVRKAMKDVLKFWLDLNIDGFRVDTVGHLVEDALLRDNPWRSPDVVGSKKYVDQIHTYTKNLEENFEIIHEWRLLLDQYEEQDKHSRFMAFEIYESPDIMKKFMGNETYQNLHFPLPFLPPLNYDTNASHLNEKTREWIESVSNYGVTSWMGSSHDSHRMASRCFPDFSEAAFMITLLLPGVVSIYYGEEIRMLDVLIRSDQITDLSRSFGGSGYSRDSMRTPMQWDDSLNAGFTKKKIPWLPVNPGYWANNVDKQLKEPKSHLKTVKRLMQLRKSPVIADGQFDSCVLSPWLFMFKRSSREEGPIFVIVNMGTELETVSMGLCTIRVPNLLEVHTASLNSEFNTGDRFIVCHNSSSSDCPELRPKAGVVLTLRSSSAGNHAGTISHWHLLLALALIINNLFRFQLS